LAGSLKLQRDMGEGIGTPFATGPDFRLTPIRDYAPLTAHGKPRGRNLYSVGCAELFSTDVRPGADGDVVSRCVRARGRRFAFGWEAEAVLKYFCIGMTAVICLAVAIAADAADLSLTPVTDPAVCGHDSTAQKTAPASVRMASVSNCRPAPA
jgi:hypothetical protein